MDEPKCIICKGDLNSIDKVAGQEWILYSIGILKEIRHIVKCTQRGLPDECAYRMIADSVTRYEKAIDDAIQRKQDKTEPAEAIEDA